MPVMVICKSVEPIAAFGGLMLVMAGTGLFTVKLTADEDPPRGVGLVAVSLATTPFAKSVAGIAAWRLPAETKVVASAVPFHSIAEEETKPEPAMVTGVAMAPAVADEGVTEAIEGVGLLAPDGGGVAITEPPPPPQPVIVSKPHKRNATTAHV